MFLPVLFGAALENMLARRKGSVGVAELELLWRNDQITVRRRDARIGDGFERFDLGRDFLRRLACKLFASPPTTIAIGMSLKMNFAIRKQRLVRHDAADLVLADEVFCGDDANDAF